MKLAVKILGNLKTIQAVIDAAENTGWTTDVSIIAYMETIQTDLKELAILNSDVPSSEGPGLIQSNLFLTLGFQSLREYTDLRVLIQGARHKSWKTSAQEELSQVIGYFSELARVPDADLVTEHSPAAGGGEGAAGAGDEKLEDDEGASSDSEVSANHGVVDVGIVAGAGAGSVPPLSGPVSPLSVAHKAEALEGGSSFSHLRLPPHRTMEERDADAANILRDIVSYLGKLPGSMFLKEATDTAKENNRFIVLIDRALQQLDVLATDEAEAIGRGESILGGNVLRMGHSQYSQAFEGIKGMSDPALLLVEISKMQKLIGKAIGMEAVEALEEALSLSSSNNASSGGPSTDGSDYDSDEDDGSLVGGGGEAGAEDGGEAGAGMGAGGDAKDPEAVRRYLLAERVVLGRLSNVEPWLRSMKDKERKSWLYNCRAAASVFNNQYFPVSTLVVALNQLGFAQGKSHRSASLPLIQDLQASIDSFWKALGNMQDILQEKSALDTGGAIAVQERQALLMQKSIPAFYFSGLPGKEDEAVARQVLRVACVRYKSENTEARKTEGYPLVNALEEMLGNPGSTPEDINQCLKELMHGKPKSRAEIFGSAIEAYRNLVKDSESAASLSA